MVLKRIILFIFTLIYIFYDNWIPTPSCSNITPNYQQHIQEDNLNDTADDDDLKVMMVADLMLSGHHGSSSGYGSFLDLDLYFKDYYFSRFFIVCTHLFNLSTYYLSTNTYNVLVIKGSILQVSFENGCLIVEVLKCI